MTVQIEEITKDTSYYIEQEYKKVFHVTMKNCNTVGEIKKRRGKKAKIWTVNILKRSDPLYEEYIDTFYTLRDAKQITVDIIETRCTQEYIGLSED